MWHVYVLRCKDGSLYTGISTNIEKRLTRHNAGKASKYTRSKRPVDLLYVEKVSTKSAAKIREIEIKKLSVVNKRHLIKFGPGQRFPSALQI